MLRVLRPTQRAELVSAQVIDEMFSRNLAGHVQVQEVNLARWCDAILGPVEAPVGQDEATRRFGEQTAGFDALMPDYHGVLLSPLLLWMRNRSMASIRMLLVAHAPGAWAMEWALLGPLLAPGDVIVAPTASAADVIGFLAPELRSFVRIVPHPMRRLPSVNAPGHRRIVSLGRIVRSKLLHRGIEAMHLLRGRVQELPRLEIAGPLTDEATGTASRYARSLAVKIRRLGLQDHVELIGRIDGEGARGRFLEGAALLLNCSVSVEESFGKAVVEAAGLGVPALATRWDGLPETVGLAGRLVEVTDETFGVDVGVERLADEIERLLDEPLSADECRGHAARFDFRRVAPVYRAVLEESLDLRTSGSLPEVESATSRGAAPTGGLLSRTAPLPSMSWTELFALSAESCLEARRAQRSRRPAAWEHRSDGARLRALLLAGTQAPLQRFLAGLDLGGTDLLTGHGSAVAAGGGSLVRLAAVGAASPATLTSRLACLGTVADTGPTELFIKGLTELRNEGHTSPGLDYLHAEALRHGGDLAAALELLLAAPDQRLWGELATARVRLVTRICREAGWPGLSLPLLRSWLDHYPDAPDSGLIWRDYWLAAADAGGELHPDAQKARGRTRALLGAEDDLTTMR